MLGIQQTKDTQEDIHIADLNSRDRIRDNSLLGIQQAKDTQDLLSQTGVNLGDRIREGIFVGGKRHEKTREHIEEANDKTNDIITGLKEQQQDTLDTVMSLSKPNMSRLTKPLTTQNRLIEETLINPSGEIVLSSDADVDMDELHRKRY